MLRAGLSKWREAFLQIILVATQGGASGTFDGFRDDSDRGHKDRRESLLDESERGVSNDNTEDGLGEKSSEGGPWWET